MEIPDLVRSRLEGENVQAGVNLGEADALFLTPTRTIIYDGEGLLSDESVSVYPHALERLSVSEGRRKTTFECTYVDGVRSFSVPASRSEKVLELFLGGVLRASDAADADEAVEGVYRFSELTLVITEQRLVKHVGTYTWDEDYEEFPFDDVTGLAFEQGSVATQIVLDVGGRPQRIKAPNDKAPMLQRTLEQALYAFYDVESTAELNRLVGGGEGDDDHDAGRSDRGTGAGFGLEDDIDPLVGGGDGDDGADEPGGVDAGGEADGEGLRPRSMDVNPSSGQGEAAEAASSGADAHGEGTEAGASDERVTDATEATGEKPSDGDAGRAAAGGASADRSSGGAGTSPETRSGVSEEGAGGRSRGDEAPAEQDTSGPGEASERSRSGHADDAATVDATAESRPGGEREIDDGSATATPSEGAELDPEDVEAIESELAELREAVQAQNEVLREQHGAIERLLSELRSE